MMHHMSPQRNTLNPPADEPAGTAANPLRVLESQELLGRSGEVVIRHNDRLYRLRRTRLGKLILTA